MEVRSKNVLNLTYLPIEGNSLEASWCGSRFLGNIFSECKSYNDVFAEYCNYLYLQICKSNAMYPTIDNATIEWFS